jgi:uncharacterized membrane protein
MSERLQVFCDAVLAIAITLLFLEIKARVRLNPCRCDRAAMS